MVELVVTLAIAAILVTIAIPGFANLIKDNRLIAGTNQLVTTLAYARSEAVKRGTPVSVCASTDGSTCTGTDWNDGWLVFSDTGTAGTVDGTDTVLRVAEALRSDLAVSVSGSSFARFQSTGFAIAVCDTACETPTMTSPAPKSMLSKLVSALLPGGAAHAGNGGGNNTGGGNGNGNGGGGGGGGGGSSVSTVALTEFTLCDNRVGATGRRISLWATGRFETTAVSCQ